MYKRVRFGNVVLSLDRGHPRLQLAPPRVPATSSWIVLVLDGNMHFFSWYIAHKSPDSSNNHPCMFRSSYPVDEAWKVEPFGLVNLEPHDTRKLEETSKIRSALKLHFWTWFCISMPIRTWAYRLLRHWEIWNVPLLLQKEMAQSWISRRRYLDGVSIRNLRSLCYSWECTNLLVG